MSEDNLKRAIFERKQEIEEYKQKLITENEGFLDKFTKQDDILGYLLQEQQRTNKHLEMSNKLLYAIYLQGQGQSISPEQINVDFGSMGGSLRTKVHDIDNPKALGTKSEIFKLVSKGFISEVKFISSDLNSDNQLYSVRIKCDDNIVYNGSWLQFASRSLHETDVTAFNDETNNVYILHFINFFFIYNFSVELYNNKAEFTQIYIKYNEEV